MTTFKSLLGPMRVPFLTLPPVCVLLGVSTAVWTTGEINWLNLILILIGATTAHISVNAFNEYFDFKSGLDTKTTRTPFSGGSGTIPAKPEMLRPALMIALVAFALTFLIGMYFLSVVGLGLLWLGLLGLLIVYIYTKWLTHSPLLCLIAPGLGFGTLMVMGTDFVLTGQYSWVAFVASLVPFFLVSNLLLLNQFPDVEADKSVGRKHFPITIGRKQSSYIYIAFLVLTYLSIVIGVLIKMLPVLSLLGLLTIFLAVPVVRGVLKNGENTEKLIPFMGQNVLLTLLTPVLMAIGILLG